MTTISETKSQFLQSQITKKVLVYGDFILDRYINGDANRISPEAPIPILQHHSTEYKVGGAANVFNSFKTLNVETYGASVFGSDDSGFKLIEMLGSGIMAVFQKDKKTSTKTRFVSRGQQLLRLDEETTLPITDEEKTFLINYFCQIMDENKILVISDYGKGCCERSFIRDLIFCAHKKNCEIFVDPHNGDLSSDIEKYHGITGIKCNLKQAQQIVGKKTDPIVLADAISHTLKCETVILTMSENGLLIYNKGQYEFIKNKVEDVFDVTGAGDATLVGFIYGKTMGLNDFECAKIANAAGNIKVQHHGTYSPTKEDLSVFFQEKNKLISLSDVKHINKVNKKVVFTNGCFDLLHAGHIAMLKFAKEQGDILVIGLNSDSSIKQLKGKTRPIIPQNERSIIISSLEFVDYVIIFDENTPTNIINELKPDIYVKGDDHSGETEGVDKTIFFPRIPQISTTRTVNLINELR